MARTRKRTARKITSPPAAKKAKSYMVLGCAAACLGKTTKAARKREVRRENGAILVTYSPRGRSAQYKEVELHIGSSMKSSVRRMIESGCKAG